VPRHLVVVVALEDVSLTLMDKVFDYFEVASVGSQVQSCPLLDSSSHVEVKSTLQVSLVLQHLVDLYDSLNAFLLSFPCGDVQRGPIVIIFDVGSSPVGD
jgi:hypothetical protein